MAIMNVVWPLTTLFAGIIALFLYYQIGKGGQISHKTKLINWQSVTKSTLHCGSGCTLGDICSELFVSFIPIYFLHSRLLGAWLLDL